MTPAARYAAAIVILDDISSGAPTERALTNWARRSRFAGSGDRAAIRDIVFDVVRKRRSAEWLGGGTTGRALVIGALRADGRDPAEVFTGEGHAPSQISEEEAADPEPLDAARDAIRLDVQDWTLPLLRDPLGESTDDVLHLFKARAPVFLRVNTARCEVEMARSLLADGGILTEPHTLATTALKVVEGARKVAGSNAYSRGLVELQDAASQAVVAEVFDPARHGEVLDFCAGGGGKALAFAAMGARQVVAHDADVGRMKDVEARAQRAGAKVELAERPTGAYPLVFCDVPCSGSGAWRRQPDAKWRLAETDLADLVQLQDSILDTAMAHVSESGTLALATCSIFREENESRAQAFIERHPDWRMTHQRRVSPLEGGDGFFVATFERRTTP